MANYIDGFSAESIVMSDPMSSLTPCPHPEQAALRLAIQTNDRSAIEASFERLRVGYLEIVGTSIVIDKLTRLAKEKAILEVDAVEFAPLGIDVDLIRSIINKRSKEIDSLMPVLFAEIDAEDRRHPSSSSSDWGPMLGAFLDGFIAGAAATPAPAPTYQAPALISPSPMNCVVIPSGRNTVTGKPYGPDRVVCQ